MKTSLYVVATALVASVNAAEPQNARDCKIAYDKEFAFSNPEASDANSKCTALVAFSKCLGQFPPDKDYEYDMIVQENEGFCAKQWEVKEPPSVRTARESLLLTVDDTKKIEFHRHRRETIDVFQMNANVNNLTDTVASLAKKMDQMMDTLTDTVTKIDGKLEKSAQEIDGKLAKSAQELEDALDDAADNQEKALGQLETKIDDKIATQATDVTDALTATTSTLSSQLKGNVTALTTKVTTLQTDVTTPKLHMWSGGAKGTVRGNSWNDFILDRVEYDTAKPYFQKDSNTRFKALKTGLFTIKWNYMHYTYQTCNRLAELYVNNKRVIYEYKTMPHWQITYIEITWRIKAGEQFYLRAKTDCGNPHTWQGGPNVRDSHGNRLQVTYSGDLAKGCTSNQGLC